MAIEDPWKPFEEIMESPLEQARSWKERTGGKVIGHLLPDVPEEILHAAGALPLAIEGAGVTASHAQAHLPSYTCNHAMGALEMGLRGELKFLDGMVIPYVCDTTRNLAHLWTRLLPELPTEFLRIPKRLDFATVRDYLAAEFSRLGGSVGEMTGHNPAADELTESIDLYNRSRARLREVYRKHREDPALWTAQRVQLVLGSAMRSAREDHLRWMESLPWHEPASRTSEDGIPIYVRGKIWDPPGILRMLDDLGFRVMRDDMVTGFRAIDQDAPGNGDPIAALVERHLATVPYTGYHTEPRDLVRSFVDRVQAAGARGILFLNPKFCEAAAFDTPDFQKALEVVGIPCLVLETSARGVSPGQIQVRLEAFREMLADDLP
jgi:benzoyl-CoA reductase subunit C